MILTTASTIFRTIIIIISLFSRRPAASQGGTESFGMMGSHNDTHDDSYGNSSQDSTLMMREVRRHVTHTDAVCECVCSTETHFTEALMSDHSDKSLFIIQLFIVSSVFKSIWQ